MTTNFSSAPSLEDLDRLFPELTIEKILQEGECFLFCLALSKSLEQEVVVQLFFRGFGKKSLSKEEFFAEAGKLVQLSHPNLIKVLDFGEVDKMPYLMTTELPGPSLAEATAETHMETGEAIRIAQGLLAGLQYGHDQGLLHGRLSPEFIYLDQNDGSAKIGTFGLTTNSLRCGGDDMDSTASPYAAPQALVGKVSTRTDVYSTAAILYFLITGRQFSLPFKPPSSFVSCDARLNEIMRKACHPSQTNRYQSAAELASDLAQLDGALVASTSAGETAFSYPLEPSATPSTVAKPVLGTGKGKNKTLTTILIGGASVLLLAGAAIVATSSKDKNDSQDIAQEVSSSQEESTSPKPGEGPASAQVAGETFEEKLVVDEPFLIGGKGNYQANGLLQTESSQVKGMEGPWNIAPKWVKRGEAKIGRHSLNYADPAYHSARGGHLHISDEGEGVACRYHRILSQSFPNGSTATVYLSFLAKTKANFGNVYRALELSERNANKREFQAFAIGFGNKAFDSQNANWGLNFAQLDKIVRLGENSGKPTLFVVKFDLVSRKNGDSVTVWQNPTLTEGNDPEGGTTISDADFSFDRISISQFGRQRETHWDEIRIGNSFLEVTTGK